MAAGVVKNVLKYGISGAGLCYCTVRYICGITQCEGCSMEPTIQDGDIVLNSPLFVNMQLLNRGDVVFCRSPKQPGSLICKRLMGLEGDTIFNNEKGYDEYVTRGQIWLEGDNQELSIDSRSYGAIPYGLLFSRGLARIWPLRRIGFISAQDVEKKS